MSLGKVIPPLVLFFICISVTGYSYARISTERNKAYDGIRIPLEESNYSIVQKGACIGNVRTKVARAREGDEVVITGELFTEQPTVMKGKLTFNDLGQMVASVATLDGRGGSLMFGTVGINPMHLVVKGTIGTPLRFEFDLPGPLVLQHKKDSVVIAQPRRSVFTNVDQTRQMLDTLALQIEPATVACPQRRAPELPSDIFRFLAPLADTISEGRLAW